MERQHRRGATCALILAVVVTVFNARSIDAKNEWKLDSDRVRQLHDALIIRYGGGMQRGNLASSFELFQELSMGPVDDVTVQCWHEMAKIYLFGLDYLYFWKRRDFGKAMELFKKAADRDHAAAQYYVSFLYTLEVAGVLARNDKQSKLYLKRAASQNYVPAILTLSYRYLYGNGCKQDVSLAIALYKKALRLNGRQNDLLSYMAPSEELHLTDKSIHAFTTSISQNMQGEERQRKDALRYWEGKASAGDGLAMYEMGKLMENNPAADAEVAKLYERASDQGVVAATRDVGLCYMNGIGVPQNGEKAIQYLTKAVDMGDHEAAKYLGYIYYTGMEKPEEGKPIKRNDELALKYFMMAAANEVPEAMYFVGEILSSRGKSVIAIRSQTSLSAAFEMYRAAADYGLMQALARETEMLEKGIGVRQNMLQAALNYKRLAEESFAITTIKDGFYTYTEKDYVSCFLHNALAAFAGVQAAQFNMGQLALKGKGVNAVANSNNMVNAALTQCYRQGDARALYSLGRLAEESGRSKVAADLYTKGFKGGDFRCLDPLASILGKDNDTLDKAIALLQHKQYRTAFDNAEDDTRTEIAKTFDKWRTWRRIYTLKAKRALAYYMNDDKSAL